MALGGKRCWSLRFGDDRGKVLVGVVGTPVNGLTGPLADEAIGDVIVVAVEFNVNGSDLDVVEPPVLP